jgi:hypothetical protein
VPVDVEQDQGQDAEHAELREVVRALLAREIPDRLVTGP